MMKQEGKKFVQQNSRTNQRESMRGQKAVNKQLIRESNRFVSDEMLHWNCGGEWWKITNMMENEESMKIDEEISAEWIGLWCPSIKREKRRSGRNDRPMNPRRYNKTRLQDRKKWTQVQEGDLTSSVLLDLKDYSQGWMSFEDLQIICSGWVGEAPLQNDELMNERGVERANTVTKRKIGRRRRSEQNSEKN